MGLHEKTAVPFLLVLRLKTGDEKPVKASRGKTKRGERE
jgi:hypothetical protein